MYRLRHLINTKQISHNDYMMISAIIDRYDESTVAEMVTLAEIVARNYLKPHDDTTAILSIEDELEVIEDRLDELVSKARNAKWYVNQAKMKK